MNVVALFVIVVSIIPVYIATRLAGSSGITAERPRRSTVAANVRSRRRSQLAATPMPIGQETPVPPSPQ